MQLLFAHDPGPVEVDDERSAGAPGRERAGLEAEQLRGLRAHRLDEAEQRHVAGMDEAQPDGEHGLQPDRAVGGLGERLALALHVLRIVRRADDVDRAVGERLDQGAGGRPRSAAAATS